MGLFNYPLENGRVYFFVCYYFGQQAKTINLAELTVLAKIQLMLCDVIMLQYVLNF